MRDIRQEYESTPFSHEQLTSSPLELAQRWFEDAIRSGVTLPNAIILATVSKLGQPSSRTVLLKGITDKGFEFFTHYQSTKGQELTGNPRCAFTLLWKELNRQINVLGVVSPLKRADNEAYFASRPRGSQISAAVSPQSQAVAEEDLLEKWKTAEKTFEGNEIPCPKDWGGYLIEPHAVEFWQGRPNRLHDRYHYSKSETGQWQTQRLAP